MNDRGSQDGVEPAAILLVEDNPGDVRLTEEGFKDGGITNTLHVVGDGLEALDFICQRNEYADAPRPDLILLDLDLPHTNGDEILEELRARPDLTSIPVVVLTGSDAQEDVCRAYDMGVHGYLTKPVDPDEFIDMIRSFEHYWLSIVRLPAETGTD